MRSRFSRLAVLALATLSACVKDAPTASPIPGEHRPPTPLGVYEIAITGLGAGEPRSSVAAAAPVGADGPRTSLTPTTSSLTIEQVGSSTFTEGTRAGGGQRYVSFTYRVRNGTGAPLNNVTLLMVSRTGTIAGTPVSTLRRFDGTDADPSVAAKVVPTGAAAIQSDLATMQGLYPDVLQVFTESEVAAITPPGDVTGIFPYGYVVRNVDPAATSRQLSVPTGANQYDGVVTVSFRLPLQPTAAQDVFSFFFQVLAVQDSETRLTESIEEAQDSAAVRRLRERAAALGATSVTVLAGSPAADAAVADYTGQRQLCSVRTAGTAGAPVTFITAPGAYSRLEMLRPGESASACGPYFRSGTPSSPVLNTAYPFTLRAMDRYGNLLTGQVDTVALSRVSGPAVSFGPSAALVNGQATINATYSAAGTSVVGATGRRVRSRRTIPVAATSTIVANTGDNQAAMAGTAVPTAPSVLVRNLGGTPLAGVPVTFTVTSGGGSVTGATATTNASGIATLGSWVMGTPGALNTVSASTPTAAGPATFRAAGCSGGGGTGYAITLCYTTTMTAAQRIAFDSASIRWSQIITGDLAPISGSIPAGGCVPGSPSFSLNIDDLVIFAGVEPIDGPGEVLADALPCYIRNSGHLPIVGSMRFDADDMALMESGGLLRGVILHEMGHVLGIGTLWSDFGLLQNPSSASGPPLDTYFSGAGGIAGFNLIGGNSYTGGNKVPVENTGGGGTANGHWRESVLATELMTGYVATVMPLSQLTARSLADMGYAINTSAADPFFLTLSVRQGVEADAIPLGNDIRALPIKTLDSTGQLVRTLDRRP